MIKKILVCTNYRANPNNPSCAARGSKKIILELTRQLQKKNISISVEESPCMGFCKVGPNIHLIPGGEFFHEVSVKKFTQLIEATKTFLRK
jgi:NADH:ubiquinone oxidoreductase subunit E